MNGVRRTMNMDKLSASFGRPLVAASINPATIPPTKAPNASPSFWRTMIPPFKKDSRSGIRAFSPANIPTTAASPATKMPKALSPAIADDAKSPIIASAARTVVITNNNSLIALAVAVAVSVGTSLSTYKTPVKAAIISIITPTAKYAFADGVFISPRRARTTAIDPIRTTNAPVEDMALSTGSCPTKNNTPPRTPTATEIRINVAVDFCTYLVMYMIKANIPIKAAIQAVPTATFVVSRSVNIAIAPTKISNDADNLSIIVPALSAFSPLNFERYVKAPNKTLIAVITRTPFSASPGSIPAMIFIATPIRIIDADI